MALTNVWHSRRVAEASAKPCDVCFKPTTAVLITPDNKDHFYVCITHLKDKGFASPIIDLTEAAEKKKKEELDREIGLVIKEYEERMKEKAKNKKDKKGDSKDQDKKKDKKEDDEDAKAEREKDEKIKAISDQSATAAENDTPRVFTLQSVFFRRRLDRLRNMEIAKRNQERMKNPSLFPTVPNGNP